MCGNCQLSRLLLHVLYGHFNRSQVKLETKKKRSIIVQIDRYNHQATNVGTNFFKAATRSAPYTCLLFLDDIDASLDVGEGMHGGEDGLPLVLLVELASRPSALGEGRGVHEAPQVEVLLKVCQTVLHLVVIEEGLHVSDLDICLERSGGVYCLLTVLQYMQHSRHTIYLHILLSAVNVTYYIHIFTFPFSIYKILYILICTGTLTFSILSLCFVFTKNKQNVLFSYLSNVLSNMTFAFGSIKSNQQGH